MASHDFEQVHLSTYLRNVQTCYTWFAAADELQFAAEQLRPQVDRWWHALAEWAHTPPGSRVLPANGCHSISMMLLAFACENLCKGAMVRDGLVDVSDATLTKTGLPRALGSHKLGDLVERVQFKATPEDRILLVRMTRAAVWRARYPAAKKLRRTDHSADVGGKQYSLTWNGESDMQRIDDLIARLREHLDVPRNLASARDATP